jgi:hypothetical protein
LSGIPPGRPQSTEDIGHACAYLASDLAANVTGGALNVSGESPVDSAIVRAVIDLADAMSIATVAEGVELPGQRAHP